MSTTHGSGMKWRFCGRKQKDPYMMKKANQFLKFQRAISISSTLYCTAIKQKGDNFKSVITGYSDFAIIREFWD